MGTYQLLFAWFGLTALVIAIWLFVLLPALEKALRPYLPTYTVGASTGTLMSHPVPAPWSCLTAPLAAFTLPPPQKNDGTGPRALASR